MLNPDRVSTHKNAFSASDLKLNYKQEVKTSQCTYLESESNWGDKNKAHIIYRSSKFSSSKMKIEHLKNTIDALGINQHPSSG